MSSSASIAGLTYCLFMGPVPIIPGVAQVFHVLRVVLSDVVPPDGLLDDNR